MKITILKSDDKQWYFTISHKNGQPIVTSETYTRRSNALKSATSLAKNLNAKTPIIYG